jgi:flagellar motor switch/type III secretory pathway protein FliN
MRRTALRRPSWPRSGSRARTAPSAPHVLEVLSRRIADNAPTALRRRMDVAFAEPERSGYMPELGGDRAWHVVEGESIVWCIVHAGAQAALLEAVLGGPGAARPTSIERAIVAETIGRLFASENLPGSQIAEFAEERPVHADWWRCNVDLTPRRGRSATLQLFALPTPEENQHPPNAAAPDLQAVPVVLSVEVAPLQVPLAHVLSWTHGALVTLPRGSLSAATIGALPNVRLATGRIGSIADSADQVSRALEIVALHRGCNA